MNTQKGFAHAFLIIGLMVAIVGALGFIFWQNFIYKAPETKTATVKTTKKKATVVDSSAKKITARSINTIDPGIKFEYPSDWKLTSNQNGTYQETLTVTSPSSDVYVQYMVLDLSKYGGIGGTCDDMGTIKESSYQQVKSLRTFDLLELVGYADSGYFYYTGLSGSDVNTRAAYTAGKQTCRIVYGVAVGNLTPVGSDKPVALEEAKIHIRALEDEHGLYKSGLTRDAIKDATNSKEYDDAKVILLSTSPKE